jgi:AraC family transcriptional regulator
VPSRRAGLPPHPLPHTETVVWPGMTSVYATLPPHAGESRTGPGQIGVAFSRHADVAWRSHGRTTRTSYAGGSVVCSGDDAIVWSDVREPTEALEIYPAADLLRGLGAEVDQTPWPVERVVVGSSDPVVLGIASVLRRTHTAGTYLSETAASTLAHRLVRHVLSRYAAAPSSAGGPGELSLAAVNRVAELVDADLGSALTLDRLSAVAHLSPYHFARSFAATTGLSPHRFVTSRRVDRARELLRSTRLPVEQVSSAVGIENVSHFRRVFRAHVGVGPAAYRTATQTDAARRAASSVSARSPVS